MAPEAAATLSDLIAVCSLEAVVLGQLGVTRGDATDFEHGRADVEATLSGTVQVAALACHANYQR